MLTQSVPAMPSYSLFSGPSPYAILSTWRPLSIVGSIVVLLILAIIGANLWTWWHQTPQPVMDDALIKVTLIFTPLQQLVMIGLAVWATYAHGGGIVKAMALVAPPQGWRAYAVSIVLFVAAIALMAAIQHAVMPGANEEDVDPFKKMFSSSGWWIALLLVGIGAPLSEELLFRGYLFRLIAQSRLGLAGAALLTSAIFALMHPYSASGMIQVFVIGLFFSWVLVRTGSLRVTMLTHGLYNSTLALLMMAGADGWL